MENTYAFIVAIENYTAGGLARVPYAEADANGFKKALEGSGIPPENITTLLNAEATKDNIKYYLFNLIANLTESDRLIFFYAGHGTRTEFDTRENYLTTHGCRDDYLLEPAIRIKDIVTKIEESECQNCCLFIDACHSELSANASIRAPISKFSPETLTEETKDSEYLVCFSACGRDQKSYSSENLKHGIWTYYLIQALSGEAPQVLEDRSVVSSKLQDYLRDSVSKHVRLEYGVTKQQTPRMSGSVTSSFAVLVLPPPPPLEQVDPLSFSLFGQEEGATRSLGGWKSGFKNWGDESFLSRIAQEGLDTHKNAVFQQLKTALKLKNKQITANDLDQGFVIETPECTFSAWIKYSENDENRYVIEFELSGISNLSTLNKIDSPPISGLLSGACETLPNLDLKASIDSLEAGEFVVETDAENTFFETGYEDPDFVIRGSGERLVLSTNSDLKLREIAEHSAALLGEVKPFLKFKEPVRRLFR